MGSSTRIQTGESEPIQLFIIDRVGNPLLGLTDIYVRLRRDSDGKYLDWADYTFKSAAWTTLNQITTEVDSVNAKGIYEVTGEVDTGLFTNPIADDAYMVIPLQTPGTNAVLPSPEKFLVGDYVDNIDFPISAVAPDVWTQNIFANTAKLTQAGGMLNILRKGLTNRLELASGGPGFMRLWDDDDTTLLLMWAEKDEAGGPIAFTVSSPAKRAKSV